MNKVKEVFNDAELVIEVENTRIERDTLLMCLGLPTANNFYKMHGGIMRRRCGKRKRGKR